MPPTDCTPCSDDLVVSEAPRSGGAIALTLIALAMGGFAIGITEFAAMSILPDFARGLGVDEPTAGHAISAYAAGVVVGAPILAAFGARFPRAGVEGSTGAGPSSSTARLASIRITDETLSA